MQLYVPVKSYYQLLLYLSVKSVISISGCYQGKLVGKAAFVRITPAISGLADRATVHNLFEALAGDEQGISLSLWLTYIDELLK